MTSPILSLSIAELEALHASVRNQRVTPPVTSTDLAMLGIDDAEGELAALFSGMHAPTLLSVLDALIAERRRAAGPGIDVVWTGPDVRAGETLSTATTLTQMFDRAERAVLLAGYSFERGTAVLEPLCRAMTARGVDVDVVLDLGSSDDFDDGGAYVEEGVGKFIKAWNGTTLPRIFYDPRQLVPKAYVSMHAKCVVVDTAECLITSANFTDRAHSRNIELGLHVTDRLVAQRIEGHWRRLIGDGHLERYRATRP